MSKVPLRHEVLTMAKWPVDLLVATELLAIPSKRLHGYGFARDLNFIFYKWYGPRLTEKGKNLFLGTIWH